jgi:alkyl sulfatase BDS1-like metallo-beta-lactamase superfamily hydrolase
MLALQTTARPGTTAGAGLRLVLDGDGWDPVVLDGTLEWRPAAETPSATLTTSSATLHRLVFRGLDLDEALADGEAALMGDRSVVEAFLTAFERPTPA